MNYADDLPMKNYVLDGHPMMNYVLDDLPKKNDVDDPPKRLNDVDDLPKKCDVDGRQMMKYDVGDHRGGLLKDPHRDVDDQWRVDFYRHLHVLGGLLDALKIRALDVCR
jgi:hypothetical protein